MQPEQAARRAKSFLLGFEPGDIVSEVMSLGSPMPIEVVVAGPKRDDVREHALKVLAEMKKIPTLRDVQLYQQLDYPTVHVDIDRQRAGLSGVTVKDVTDSLLVGTSSSRYVAKNYWRDPSSGVDYQVQVQVPTPRMDHPEQIQTLPLQKVNIGHEPDDPRRGQGPARHGSRTGGPQLDAALLEHHRQRRRRGPRPGLAPHRAGDCRRRRAAARRARAGPRPGRTHGGDVRHPLPRA